MLLSKTFCHRNFDVMFRLVSLSYGRIMEKNLSKLMQDNLMSSMIVNLSKIDFFNKSRTLNS